jgi:outer membrane protein OmpA-like peptidoglycan-associated protein
MKRQNAMRARIAQTSRIGRYVPLAVAAMFAALWAVAPAARAQGVPSVDEIIQQLKPSSAALQGATRGIRPLPPGAAEPAKPAPGAALPGTTGSAAPPTSAAPPAAQPGATASAAAVALPPSITLYVLFNTGSAELTPSGIETLDRLGQALSSSALASYRFRIEGHTDTVGTDGYNMELSQQRAAAVSAYLEKKFGLQAARLEVVGVGTKNLIVATPPQTPEPRNRGVKVVNLGA